MRLGCGAFAAGCVAVEVLGVALFLRGFFPPPVRSSSQPAPPAAPEPSAGASSSGTKLLPPLFGKVVVMLIDGLRDDFVFGSKGVKFMPYTTYLVEEGASHSFVAEAKPPTVTMPRIKALVTGSLPGFVDVVRNLNSPALLEDNVVTRATAAGKRVIFYGDETWVKLFPKHFVEYDGTTSFFVSDYTEVDDNVTRHLDKVLKRGDWDVLILHYLGLDHIGHISGPSSPLIGRKLSEMDSILMRIHTSLQSEEREALSPSLLVLCGDHGMSESGGHGAASLEEVSTALLLTSSAFSRKPGEVRPPERVQQTDLAATLAVGLGLPIPQHSVGRFLFPVMQGRAMREQLRFLHLNAVQLSRLLQASNPVYEREPGFEQFKMSERLHGNWVRLYLENNNSEVLLNLGAKVRRQYLGALKSLSRAVSSQVAQYDIYSMVLGTVVVLEVLALLLLSIPQALGAAAELEVPLSPVCSLLFYLAFLLLWAMHVVVCTSAERSRYLCSLTWPMAGGVLALVSALLCGVLSALTRTCVDGKLLRRNPTPSSWRWSELDFLTLAGTAGHVLSLGASSFIEEEHQTWYFLVSTLCLALCHESYRACFLGEDGEPRHCSSPASALQDRSVSCDVLELDQACQSPSSLDGLGGREKYMALASPWLVLGCCRLLRSLNQTGVQWAHRPDLGHWLTSSEHQAELSILSALSLLAIFALVQSRCSPLSKGALALGLLGVYCYRTATGHLLFPWQQDSKDLSRGIIEARFVYVFVLGILFTGIKQVLKSQVLTADVQAKTVGLWDVHSALVLLAALLFRPHNLPVLLCSLLTQTLMARFLWRPLGHGAAEVTIMHYWFGQAFFYFQGNSNNIATVDISAGFVGLNTYMEVPAMFLTAFATYAGPVLWASHLVNFLSWEPSSDLALGRACFCYALLSSIPVSAYIVLVTALRYHLFIWSVFSPKLLYEGMHLLVTAALCLCFTAVGRSSTKADTGRIARC
ncbi:GPI ethanolamine phosphate transferase 2 isoform X2 [Pipistrellus kuhlii]|uniref:Phosphatidylinositol glycan anchor biosynthesis class G n=1 Tax=Pipistrellus kuhlii TaxID=59472 RepID=A0A7J7RW55_PIPKU|nr:GPI ethanolamine phosphate transferase 2 isoform X2 [Pipistrellus kuhlii]KAF6280194.1 phosphatidylinositol glycan anchor biosynthesis class G [Pipistrellus kuhlii]